MDRAKNLAKGGWHPSGDKQIHRKTWKSDLKGVATGKSNDPNKKHYENAMSHQSAPLAGLKDPDSFGPPPKHQEFYDEQGNSLNPVTPVAVSRYTGPESVPGGKRQAPGGGWGTVVQTPNRKKEEEEQKQAEEEARANRGPYKADTTGLSTNNLPAPPVRRDAPAPAPGPPPPPRNVASPASPPVPQRQPQAQARAAPPPVLPPRMNDHPDEYTPPAPPPYNEATKPGQPNPAALNAAAVNNLGQAGVSVSGFGIGNNQPAAPQSPASPQGHSGQLSELQQRFARMRSSSGADTTTPASPTSSTAAAAAAAQKKPPPPPPPPKKPNLAGAIPTPPGSSDGTAAPPPLPMASKPRPN
jgi:hypothetical protein